MSTPTARCPRCYVQFPIAASARSVVCPSCEARFDPSDDAPRKAKPVARTARPVSPPPARDRREADDRPRTRSRRVNRPGKGGTLLPLLVIGGLFAVLVSGAVAIGVVVFSGPQVAQATSPATIPDNTSATNPAEVPPAPVAPVVTADPLDRLLGDVPPPVFDRNVDPQDPNGRQQPPKPPEPAKPARPGPRFAAVVPPVITSAPLTGDKAEVRLPGKVADTCVGGGGRYFLLLLSEQWQLAIFDVTEAKVVKYLPMASATARIAAGMNKLIVAYPTENLLVRYDLGTFEKEETHQWAGDTIDRIALGSASAGPLLVTHGTDPREPYSRGTFLDPATFKPVDIQYENKVAEEVWESSGGPLAAPNGRVFITGRGGSTLAIRGGWARLHAGPGSGDDHLSSGRPALGPDGNVYSQSGVYVLDMTPIGVGAGHNNNLLPAAEGPWHLRTVVEVPGPGQMTELPLTLEVRAPGDPRPLAVFKDVPPISKRKDGDLSEDRRVHFVPAANLLVTIPHDDDRLVLRKFDLDAAATAGGTNHPRIVSRPPAAVPGQLFDYQLVVKSKKGGVRYSLDVGPPGMTVDAAGKVTWQVPADLKQPQPVAIGVSDASGFEVPHAFELTRGETGRWARPLSRNHHPEKATDPDPQAGRKLVPYADRVFEVKPPPVEEKTTVELGGVADEVCAGGGGRFLIYRLPKQQRLVVLDVTAGRVVKNLPLSEPDALFAAGMTKLFVHYKTAGVFVRYDLETFKKELTVPSPLGGNPWLMRIGHASEGPVYVGGAGVAGKQGYGFLHAATLTELNVPIDTQFDRVRSGPAVDSKSHPNTTWVVSVAPSGRALSWGEAFGSTRVMMLGELGAVGAECHMGLEDRGSALMIGPDGHLFGGGGPFTPDLKPMIGNKRAAGEYLPAASGGWYLKVVEVAEGRYRVSLHFTTDVSLDVTLTSPELDHPPRPRIGETRKPHQKFTVADRLRLIPDAEALVVLDPSCERVVLQRLSLKDLVEKRKVNSVLVFSRPPPAVRGQNWQFTPDVWADKEQATVKVKDGPNGLTAAGGGLNWQVPADFPDEVVPVRLTVSAGGREVDHSFELTVRAATDPAVVVLRPKAADLPKIVPVDVMVGGRPTKAFTITPTKANDKDELTLPGPTDAHCFGGGGRFVLFRIPSKKQLLVFDASAGKVLKALPLPSATAPFAAGMSEAVVFDPVVNDFTRYSLSTLNEVGRVKNPLPAKPDAIALGHATDGPLLAAGKGVGGGDNLFALLDPLTVTRVDRDGLSAVSAAPALVNLPQVYPNEVVATASADGRSFVYYHTAKQERFVVTLPPGNPAEVASVPELTLYALPGHDGKWAMARGLIDPTEKPPLVVPNNPSDLTKPPPPAVVPAADGPWYLELPPDPQRFKFGKDADKSDDGQFTLRLANESECMLSVPDPAGVVMRSERMPGVAPVPGRWQKRFIFLPQAELLMVFSPDRDRVHLNRLDPKSLFDAAKPRLCLIPPAAPPPIQPGKKWTYTPPVWTTRGGVTLKLTTAPAGMTAAGDTLTWDPPADLLDGAVRVTFTATDAGDQTATGDFVWPVAAAPISLEVTARPDVDLTPAPKKGVQAMPFDTAWAEYLASTGLAPATFQDNVVRVELPERPVGDGVAGGGGRYLVVAVCDDVNRAPTKVTVVDLSTARAVYTLSLPAGFDRGDSARKAVAADRTRLFTLVPTDADKRVFRLTRYAVATGKEERSAAVTLPGPAGAAKVVAVVAGASSTDTPLLVLTADGQLTAIDPDALTVLDGAVSPPKGKAAVKEWKPTCLAVSADGRRVVCQPSSGKDDPLFVVGTWTGKAYEWATGGEKGELKDGRITLTTGGLVYTSTGTYHPTGKPFAPGGQRGYFGKPSAVGPLLEREFPKTGGTPLDFEARLVFGPGQPPAGGGIFTPTVMTRPSISVVEPLGVLAAVTHDDRNWRTPYVAIHRFDLPKLLAASTATAPILAVHTPPAERGKKYTLTPLAWLSSTERPVLTLTAGPPGMTLTVDGRLEWPVPENYDEPFTPVTLVATATSGAEASITVYPAVVSAGSVKESVSPVVIGPRPPVFDPKPPVFDPNALKDSPFAIARREYLTATGLKPATFKGERVEVKLSGSVREGIPMSGRPVVGGNGQYLAFRYPTKGKMEVVDLSTATVAFDLPYDEKAMAVGMNRTHLFVRDSKANTLTRYDLTTGKSDKTVQLDLGPTPGWLVGAAGTTDTPLLALVKGTKTAIVAIDPATLGVYRGAIELPAADLTYPYAPVLASGGRRVLLQCGSGQQKKAKPAFYIGTLVDQEFVWAAAVERPLSEVGIIDVLTASGRAISPLGGFDPKGEPVAANGPEAGRRMWWYQAADGPLAMFNVPSNPASPREQVGLRFAFAPDQPRFSVNAGLGLFSPVALCEGLGVVVGEDRSGTLVIHKLDVEKGLAGFRKSDDPLIALSTPVAERGKPFVVTPAVWAKDDKVVLRLDAGPPGMTLTTAGKLEWAVPPNFPDLFATVTLTATTPQGKSTVTVFPAVVGAIPGRVGAKVELVEAKAFALKAEAPPTPGVKDPVASAKAAPFEAAWKEYLKGTGLTPATFKGDSVEVKLNGAIFQPPLSAGGGRYLVYPLVHKGVDVVDLATGTVAFHAPHETVERVVAANLTHLFVFDSAARKVHRYDLATGKNDKSAALKPAGQVSAFVGPSASATQPLLMLVKSTPAKILAIDPNTLEILDGVAATPGKETEITAHKPFALSADGRRVTYIPDAGADAVAFHLGTWTGTKYEWTAATEKRGSRDFHRVIPTAGGLFTPYRALAPDGTRVTEPPAQAAKFRRWHPSEAGPGVVTYTEYQTGDPCPVGVQFGPGQPVIPTQFTVQNLIARATLVEPLGVVVLHPSEANTITIHKLDLPKLLAAHTGDVPVIAFHPPAVERGKLFVCTPAVWAKGGDRPILRLDEAPKGMTLTDNGRLVWDVPNDFPDPFVTVTLSTAAGGKSSKLVAFPAVVGAEKPSKGAKPEEPKGNIPPVKPEEPKGNIPPPKPKDPLPDPIKPPPPVVAPPPVPNKNPVASAKAVAFEVAWEEYLKGNGQPPAVFKGESVTIPLSGESGIAPVSAGGGRYLIFTVPKIAVDVIDLTRGVKAFSIPLAGDWVLTAANRTHLFVLDSKEKTIDRYDLATGKKDKSAALDPGGPPSTFVGPASADGPLCLRVRTTPAASLMIVDPETLTAKATATPLPKEAQLQMKWKAFTLSADGRRAAYTPDSDTTAPVFHLGIWEGDTFHWTAASNPWESGSGLRTMSHAPTGFYTPRVVYDPDGRPAKPDAVSRTRSWYPSPVGPALAVYAPWATGNDPIAVHLHFGPDQPPIDTPMLSPKGFGRVTCVEPLGVTAYTETAAKSVTVTKFDLKKMLAGHRGEEPLIALYPPTAERGKPFAVTPAVWAKGSVRPTLKLTAAPKEMTLTDNGRIVWDVPKDFPEPFVTVTLAATTAEGKASKITVYPAVTAANK